MCIVASKLLELRSHGASLSVLAAKLSEQLIATRHALTDAERQAAQVPILDKASLTRTESAVFSLRSLGPPVRAACRRSPMRGCCSSWPRDGATTRGANSPHAPAASRRLVERENRFVRVSAVPNTRRQHG